MNRYFVAFASALVGLAVAVPYAVLKFSGLPAKAPRDANMPPGQMSFEEQLVIAEVCVVFYAVTYFTGRRVYAMLGRREDLRAVEQFSGGHMRLLHSLVGCFLIASPWLDQPGGNRNPLTVVLSMSLGLAMLGSGIVAFAGWARSRLTRSR